MVTELAGIKGITRFGRSGLQDWLYQRLSAIVIGLYVLFLIYFFLSHSPLQFEQWQTLFAITYMKVASIFVLISFAVHSWIGLWSVTTDYLKESLRLLVQVGLACLNIGMVIWGVLILWAA